MKGIFINFRLYAFTTTDHIFITTIKISEKLKKNECIDNYTKYIIICG